MGGASSAQRLLQRPGYPKRGAMDAGGSCKFFIISCCLNIMIVCWCDFDGLLFELQIIAVCCIDTGHWVVVRILPKEWKVELYDSHSHLHAQDAISERDFQMKPITRLLPKIFHTNGYFDTNFLVPKTWDELSLVKMPPSEQFAQTDSHSCGPFACMYLDRLVSKPTIHRRPVDERYIKWYRRMIAIKLYSLGCH